MNAVERRLGRLEAVALRRPPPLPAELAMFLRCLNGDELDALERVAQAAAAAGISVEAAFEAALISSPPDERRLLECIGARLRQTSTR